jgi:predicted nucleic acid-binding protein
MHLIDTNIFLELLLNQEKKDIAEEILTFDNDFRVIKDLTVHILK